MVGTNLALLKTTLTGYATNPVEAVAIHKDIGSKWSLGIHWGTFPLTAESPLSPLKNLKEALEEAKLPPEAFITLALGETRKGSVTETPVKDSVVEANDKASIPTETVQ